MVAPLILKIVVFSLAKKAVVFLVAKLYGFPRVYRRVSKFNHYINHDNPKRMEKFQNRLQFLFRLPSHVYRTVQHWRGVEPPQGPPASASGHPHGATSGHSQHKQVREIHTGSGALRVISSLSVPNLTSRLSGSGSISQSIRSHLLGLGGGSRTSRTRPFSGSSTLPFGVSLLMTPRTELKSSQAGSVHFCATGSIDSHVAQITLSLQDFQSGYLWTTTYSGLSVHRCLAQKVSVESSFRSFNETMVSTIDESRNSTPKSVGLSCIL